MSEATQKREAQGRRQSLMSARGSDFRLPRTSESLRLISQQRT